MMTYAAATTTPEVSASESLHPWDTAAAGWNHHAALIHAWLHDATQTMLDEAHIGPGGRVLDIAAGAGDQTLDIARRIGPHGRVLATDLSPAILALAQKKMLKLKGFCRFARKWPMPNHWGWQAPTLMPP